MDSDEVVGTILNSVAEETGLAKGTPVVAGALDTSATAIGLGAIHEKDACVILAQHVPVRWLCARKTAILEQRIPDTKNNPIKELYVELQPTLNGTPNIDWMLQNISNTKDFSEIDKMVESVPVAAAESFIIRTSAWRERELRFIIHMQEQASSESARLQRENN